MSQAAPDRSTACGVAVIIITLADQQHQLLWPYGWRNRYLLGTTQAALFCSQVKACMQHSPSSCCLGWHTHSPTAHTRSCTHYPASSPVCSRRTWDGEQLLGGEGELATQLLHHVLGAVQQVPRSPGVAGGGQASRTDHARLVDMTASLTRPQLSGTTAAGQPSCPRHGTPGALSATRLQEPSCLYNPAHKL